MAMQIRAELCHVDTLRCVVRVEGWDGNKSLGSALGEDQTCEAAEDRAIRRLKARLGSLHNDQGHRPDHPSPVAKAPQASTEQEATGSESTGRPSAEVAPPSSAPNTGPPSSSDLTSAPAAEPDLPSEAPTDPEDWSEELTAIDLELRRIGWDRSLERLYLERAFGNGSRHRLTRYADLVAFLRQLRQIDPGEKPETASVPIRRSDLIQQGDQMLHQLQWTREQARDFLLKHQQANSRQQLSDEQLLQFNILLEDQLNAS